MYYGEEHTFQISCRSTRWTSKLDTKDKCTQKPKMLLTSVPFVSTFRHPSNWQGLLGTAQLFVCQVSQLDFARGQPSWTSLPEFQSKTTPPMYPEYQMSPCSRGCCQQHTAIFWNRRVNLRKPCIHKKTAFDVHHNHLHVSLVVSKSSDQDPKFNKNTHTHSQAIARRYLHNSLFKQLGPCIPVSSWRIGCSLNQAVLFWFSQNFSIALWWGCFER